MILTFIKGYLLLGLCCFPIILLILKYDCGEAPSDYDF